MKKEYKIMQVKDDPALLELMLEDSKTISNLYQPTNYWTVIDKYLIPELRSKGLYDFRRRRSSLINFFGTTDLLPISQALQNPTSKKLFPLLISLLFKLSFKTKKLQNTLNHIADRLSGVSLKDINLLCFKIAELYGKTCGAKSIYEFEASHAGNPEHVFYKENKMYNISSLFHYIQYAYCCRFLNFDQIKTVAEIGSGFGKQTEVIKKLHPHLTFYLFDLAPQLYVCEQYLSTIFPDSVVSYRQTRTMNHIPEDQKGKIFIFVNWKISELDNLNYDMFWNSASFQEMEPKVVQNYLMHINKQTNRFVFLNERMKGIPIATKKGLDGVLEPVKLKHYEEGLKDFKLKDLSEPIHIPRLSEPSYSYSLWIKK